MTRKPKDVIDPRPRQPLTLDFYVSKVGSKKNNYSILKRGAKMFIGANSRSRDVVGSITSELTDAMWQHVGVKWPLTPPYRVDIVYGKGVRVDIDNGQGHVYDCLQKVGIIENDKRIREASQKWGPDVLTKITVSEI